MLRQLFDYDPESGALFWRYRPDSMFTDGKQAAAHNAAIWNGKNAGNPACSKSAAGYLETSIWSRRVYAHRVIWKLVHGVDAADIDHVNGDRADNRLSNLRNVSHAANGKNMKVRKNNTSGVMGVRWEERLGKWHARIMPGRRNIHLGVFDSFDDAVAARRAAEVRYGYHPNHGQR